MNVAVVQDPNVCWKGVPTTEVKTVVQTTPTALYTEDTFVFGARIIGGAATTTTVTPNAATVDLFWSTGNTGGVKWTLRVPIYDPAIDNAARLPFPTGVAVNLKGLYASSASANQKLTIETYRNPQ